MMVTIIIFSVENLRCLNVMYMSPLQKPTNVSNSYMYDFEFGVFKASHMIRMFGCLWKIV